MFWGQYWGNMADSPITILRTVLSAIASADGKYAVHNAEDLKLECLRLLKHVLQLSISDTSSAKAASGTVAVVLIRISLRRSI